MSMSQSDMQQRGIGAYGLLSGSQFEFTLFLFKQIIHLCRIILCENKDIIVLACSPELFSKLNGH